MLKRNIVIICIYLVSSVSVVMAQAKPLNYQDCILEATREGYARDWNDIGNIKQNCEERFPDTAPQMLGQRISNKLLDKLEIYMHAENDGSINGTLYNGNSHIYLTRIHVLLTPRKDDPVQDFFDSEEFEVTVKVLPNKTGTFTIPTEEVKLEGSFRTQLIKAWGY